LLIDITRSPEPVSVLPLTSTTSGFTPFVLVLRAKIELVAIMFAVE